DHMTRVRTADFVSMSPELFEKVYLNPINRGGGDLRRNAANPTPLGLVGFVIALTPLCCVLMGWHGTEANPPALIGAFYWFGGFLQAIAGILEFFIGNTFPFIVLTSFGAFFFTYASTLTPAFAAASSYDSPADFHANFGFFPLFMGLLCLLYFLCSLRTNIVFAIIFFCLVLALAFLTAGHWYAAAANATLAERMEIAAGASAFVSAAMGWYLLASQMLQAVDFPMQLPVGDLSTIVKGS
ncbi:hypothetical protein K491DRAFT_556493, partial [Lophiostoma macrostomum CBS 122681]